MILKVKKDRMSDEYQILDFVDQEEYQMRVYLKEWDLGITQTKKNGQYSTYIVDTDYIKKSSSGHYNRIMSAYRNYIINKIL